jgi:hypothetical protein
MKYQKLMVALATVAFLGLVSASVQAQTVITNSPHDLSSGVVTDPDKNEVCAYCHTPHGGAGASAGAPLWNKTVDDPTVYSLYDDAISSTLDGEVLASVGGVSLACLSCHDGSQAVDSVINAPGTGLGTSPLGSAGSLSGVAAVGEADDLTNDHPIAILYGGHLTDQVGFEFFAPDQVGTEDLWYIDRGTDSYVSGARDNKDIILYTRPSTQLAGNGGFVECGSCHDPHSGDESAGGDNALGTNAPGSNVSFMRVANDGSALCLSCHIK